MLKLANTLTEKENIFCMAIADGKSQFEAYNIAYDTKTKRRNTVDCNASKVMAKPHIKERIAELQERKENAKVYSDINDINKRYNIIWQQIDKCIANNDNTSVARYMDIINKMTGAYVNITKDISDNKPLEKLSEDDLKALIGKVE